MTQTSKKEGTRKGKNKTKTELKGRVLTEDK
jgi:hypothetical protein